MIRGSGWGYSIVVLFVALCGVETRESGLKKRVSWASRFEWMSRFHVTLRYPDMFDGIKVRQVGSAFIHLDIVLLKPFGNN